MLRLFLLHRECQTPAPHWPNVTPLLSVLYGKHLRPDHPPLRPLPGKFCRPLPESPAGNATPSSVTIRSTLLSAPRRSPCQDSVPTAVPRSPVPSAPTADKPRGPRTAPVLRGLGQSAP